MDDLREQQAQSLGHTLFRCARLLDEVAQVRVNRAAGRQVMRPALARLLPFLDDPAGVRVGVLAERADVSKQAVSQTLAALEEDGLVVLRDDPDDARAKRVFLTASGRAGFGHGLQVLAKIERELSARVGARAVSQLFESLRAVLPALVALHEESAAPEQKSAPTKPTRPTKPTKPAPKKKAALKKPPSRARR